ncbi:MAG: hypothetical protein JSV88_14640, partial [Candidatus Aminicenantes bacterium]
MKYYLKISMLMTAFLIFILPVFSQQDHREIVEEVRIDWWQVPIFAVNKAGNPITDLEPGDIDIIINGKPISRFTLHQRTFLVTETKETIIPDPSVPRAHQDMQLMKPKVIFLLFDLTLSSESGIIRSKQIAEDVIRKAEKDTYFFILTIEPFKGLNYIGEGTDNRDELVWLTRQKVKRLANNRIVSGAGIELGMPGRRVSKYTGIESGFFRKSAAAYFKRKSMGFFYSFEILYLYLNSIEANKFVYFFSEGVSNSVIGTIKGGLTMYRHYLKEMANYLSRSSAVLFIINAMGVINSYSSGASGENSLHFLAQQSGGKYLEGDNIEIVQSLENMHRAYYEISFPDIPVRKDTPRKITITSNREGVSIHSLRRLEKSKKYSQMNDIEKELTALNVITRNPLFKTKALIHNAKIIDTRHTGKKKTYTAALPDSCLNKTIDLYKFWILIDPDNPAAAVKKLEKESLVLQKNKLEIEFKVKD